MIAEALGDFFVGVVNFFGWVFTDIGPVALPIGLFAAYLLWRVVLVFGPMKLCWRCKGKGHLGGLFGGRRKCGSCSGEGIRPRVGSGK
jgi:hypothetical protein